MKRLFMRFPRQVGVKRNLVKNRQEFLNWVNNYQGVKHCYFSVYALRHGGFEDAYMDKVYFDFDGENAQDDVLALSDRLVQEGHQHLITFSGRKGFHLYIFTTGYKDLQHTKGALHNAHTHYISELGIDVDDHVVGDIARVSRVPNTVHLKSGNYCVPVTRDMLRSKSFDEICDYASEQRNEFTYYGDSLLDISEFDEPVSDNDYGIDEEKIPTFEQQFEEPDDEMLEAVHPAIRVWLQKPKDWCTNRTRYLWALYCKAKAIPPELCDKIAKKYWSSVRETGGPRTKYQEFDQESQIKYAYGSNSQFPYLDTLCRKNLVPGSPEDYPPLRLYYGDDK